MADLKNKANLAIELSKKHGKIRIFMYVSENKIDNSKNLLYTVKY